MYESPPPAGAFPTGPGPSYATSYVGGETAQQIIDDEHLRLLRIGYFISAAQTAILIPFGLLYAGMGLMFSHLPTGGAPPPPALMSWFMGLFGAGFAGFGAVTSTLKLLTAIRLKQRRSRVLCLVAAGLSCLEIPYGTLLGVWTFTVLGRASVQRKFEA
ncbi:MAG: hypothetical protein ABUL60_29295 [Myxococcales bacterium]